MEILSLLISQLKNPLQYIFVGGAWCAFIYYDVPSKYIMPFFLIATGSAGLLQSVFNKIKRIIWSAKYKQEVLNHLLQLTDRERAIVYSATKNGHNSIKISMEQLPDYHSLKAKGIAYMPTGTHMFSVHGNDIPVIITAVALDLIRTRYNEIF